MKQSTTSADIRTPAGHGEIPVITPILSMYLSTTSDMFNPADHDSILHDLSKETIAYFMMHSKNMKAIVRSPVSNNVFDVVARVFEGDT